MERSKGFITRFAVAALSMTMMVAMFAGTANAAAATNTTKGSGPGDASPTASPTYAWAGSDIVVNLSITTDATLNVQEFWLFGSGGGICVLTDADTVTVSGPGRCTVYGRVYSGNTFDANTDEMEIIVNKGTQATLTTDASTGAVYGKTVNLSASGGTTSGTITYTKVSGDCSVDNASATATVTALSNPAVNCVVRATMAGNTYYESVLDDVTITVSKAAQNAFHVSASDKSVTNGDVVTLSSSGELGSGAVTYSKVSGDCTVSGSTATITGGTNDCVVRATRAADDNYLEATDDATIDVSKGTQASLQILTDGTDGTSAGYDTTVALTNDGGGSGTGGVTYSQVSGDCTVSGSTATITGVTTSCVVRATRAADDNYLVKTDDATITVGKATQAPLIALTDGTDGTSAYLTTVALSYSGGSGDGAVTFAKVSGNCTVSGTTATITGSTTDCIVEATRAANDNYYVITDRVTILVSGNTQATFTALANGYSAISVTPANSTSIALSSSGGSGGGAVTFAKISGDCTVAGSTATITGYSNNCVVEATSAAAGGYAAATDQVTITVSSASLPTTSVSPTARRSSRNAVVTGSGTWNANGGTLSAASYQWYQCTSAKSAVAAASSINAPADCVEIPGATTSTWRIAGVSRKYLRVLVTRSNAAGSAYAWSKTFKR